MTGAYWAMAKFSVLYASKANLRSPVLQAFGLVDCVVKILQGHEVMYFSYVFASERSNPGIASAWASANKLRRGLDHYYTNIPPRYAGYIAGVCTYLIAFLAALNRFSVIWSFTAPQVG